METEFKSLQAEQELLGAIMTDNEIIPDIAENLSPEDLYSDRHKLIYSKVLSLYKSSQQVTAITLYETLQGTEIKISDLLDLKNTSPSVVAYKDYMNIIKDYKKKRDIVKFCNQALSELSNNAGTKVSTDLTERLYEINTEKTKQSILDATALMERSITYIDNAYQTKGASVGLKTGWVKFDYATNGFAKGDLVILGGRPSMGKTAFALELIQGYARNGHASALFEMEMSGEKLGIRLLSANTETRAQKIYKGEIEDLELRHLISEADKISRNNKIFVDETPGVSLLHIRNRVRQLKQQHNLEVVIVDHITLMSASDPKKDTHTQITEISKGLKAIAKEYDIVVIALSQLNREVEKRPDKRPKLSDLRESGSLEQDADIVLLVYRDGYYYPENVPARGGEQMEINIAKARDGKVGVIMFEINLGTQKITEFISTEERVSRVGGKR